jgi:hypothetical protein
VQCTNPRDFATGNYRRVDDRPFGGGPGMVMMAQPLELAWPTFGRSAQTKSHRWCCFPLSANGLTMRRCSGGPLVSGAILVCGRYEGIDQRFIDAHVDEQISLGDFVLSGGEMPPWPCWMPWPACSPVCCRRRQPPAWTASTRRWMAAGLPALHPARRVGGCWRAPMFDVRPPWANRTLAARPAAANSPPSTAPICWRCAQGRATHSAQDEAVLQAAG